MHYEGETLLFSHGNDNDLQHTKKFVSLNIDIHLYVKYMFCLFVGMIRTLCMTEEWIVEILPQHLDHILIHL